jgi:hypothetical protein
MLTSAGLNRRDIKVNSTGAGIVIHIYRSCSDNPEDLEALCITIASEYPQAAGSLVTWDEDPADMWRIEIAYGQIIKRAYQLVSTQIESWTQCDSCDGTGQVDIDCICRGMSPQYECKICSNTGIQETIECEACNGAGYRWAVCTGSS